MSVNDCMKAWRRQLLGILDRMVAGRRSWLNHSLVVASDENRGNGMVRSNQGAGSDRSLPKCDLRQIDRLPLEGL